MSESPTEIAPRKLPLRRIMAGAFVLPWRNRVAVLRAAALPLFLVIAAIACGYADYWSVVSWLGTVGFLLAFPWLAVTIHRLLLAHDWNPQPIVEELRLGRLLRFFGAVLLITIVGGALYLALLELSMSAVDVAADLTGASSPEASSWDWVFELSGSMEVVVDAITYCATARFCLVLPAIALDRAANYGAAWRMSRGNGWRVVIAVGGLPWLLDSMSGLLWRDGATLVELGGLAMLMGIVVTIEVVVLSLTYSELTRVSAPPPTHPPV